MSLNGGVIQKLRHNRATPQGLETKNMSLYNLACIQHVDTSIVKKPPDAGRRHFRRLKMSG
jgi:hypothetical protein